MLSIWFQNYISMAVAHQSQKKWSCEIEYIVFVSGVVLSPDHSWTDSPTAERES